MNSYLRRLASPWGRSGFYFPDFPDKTAYRVGFGGLFILLGYFGLLSITGAIGFDNVLFWLPLADRYNSYSHSDCDQSQKPHCPLRFQPCQGTALQRELAASGYLGMRAELPS